MKSIFVYVAAFLIGMEPASGFSQPESSGTADREPSSTSLFSTELPNNPSRPRDYFLPPLASFFLPGFDQWWEGQYPAALMYTGAAAGGVSISAAAISRLNSRNIDYDTDLDNRDNDVRSLLLGTQIYMAAGSFSAYSSFRSAVRTRQPYGEFQFLKKEETTGDLLLAPLSFGLLKRPSTFVPLLIVLTAVGGGLAGESDNPLQRNSFNGDDIAFAGSFSYLAGTNEEALFRGWMMPYFMNSWGSPFWSNAGQATIFAAAHISGSNSVPWPQLLLGWYLGYLTQENDWTLKESVFIHTWWDVIAFTGSYLHESHDKAKEAWLHLPVVSLTF